MEQLLQAPNPGEIISQMSKAELSTLLESEKLSTQGTKKQLQERLLEFINDRREQSERVQTIFETSLEENPNLAKSNFPPPPEVITTHSFDTAIQNLLSDGQNLRADLNSALPISRSTVQLTEVPLLTQTPTFTQTIASSSSPISTAINPTVTTNTQTQFLQFLPQNTNIIPHSFNNTTHTNSSSQPIVSSTLNASASQFQLQFLNSIHNNQQLQPH